MASYPPPPGELPPPPDFLLPPPPPPMPPPWRAPEPAGWHAWSNGKKAVVGGAIGIGALLALGFLGSLANPKPSPTAGAAAPTASRTTASPASATPTGSAAPTPVASPTQDLRPAAFELSGLTINPNWAAPGAAVLVSIDIANRGGLAGSHVIELTIDGGAVGSQEITLGGGESKTVTFDVPDLPLGPHAIDVNGETDELKVADVQRPDSGTLLVNRGRKGQGHLTVENGTDRDAIVALARASNLSRTPVAIYIRAGSTETVNKIGDGTYAIFFGFGSDWDTYSEHFLTDANYGRFSDELTFETTATTLPGWRLSLQPVVGGNAPTDDIGEGDFPVFGDDGE